MGSIRSVAVFCGSRMGVSPRFAEATRLLGEGLGRRNIRLVYGGGRVGLMGVLADSVLAAGGDVIGVIPEFLRRSEVAHPAVTDLRVTESMHERKRQMFAIADAFVTMPGGLGTFDETFEIITWRQLGLHDKPILICDVDGWSASLLGLIEHAIRDGFAPETARALFEAYGDVDQTLSRLESLGPAVGEQTALL